MSVPALVLTAVLAASPGRVVLVASGFDARNLDAVTAGMLAQRFASGLAAKGIELRSLAELAKTAPAADLRKLEGCREASPDCLAVLRSLGAHGLLLGSVGFIIDHWEFSVRAVDVRDGSPLYSAREAQWSRAALEQRLDVMSAAFGARLPGAVARPPAGNPAGTTKFGRNALHLGPALLLLGGLQLEYERALSQQYSVLLAAGAYNVFEWVVPRLGAQEARLELSARYYGSGSAPEGCYLSMSVKAGRILSSPNDFNFGGAALLGCAIGAADTILFNIAVGAGIMTRTGPNFDGRLSVGYAF